MGEKRRENMNLTNLNEQMERRGIRNDNHRLTRNEFFESATVIFEVLEGIGFVFSHLPKPFFGIPAVVESEQALKLVAAERTSTVALQCESFESGPTQIRAVRGAELRCNVVGNVKSELHRCLQYPVYPKTAQATRLPCITSFMCGKLPSCTLPVSGHFVTPTMSIEFKPLTPEIVTP